MSATDTSTSVVDSDNDGVSDADEQTIGTNPQLPDTDGDGTTDNFEIAYGFNPLDPSSKPITALSRREPPFDGRARLGQDAASTLIDRVDSDEDGVSDALEVLNGFDPEIFDEEFGEDSDRDGLFDFREQQLGTNPLSADSDKDALSDAAELALNFDPLDPDTDDDGVLDGYVAENTEGVYTFDFSNADN